MDLSTKLREKHEKAIRSSRIKLVAMVILLIVVLVVMWELNRVGRQAMEKGDTFSQEEEAAPAPPPIDTKAKAKLPEGEAPDVAPLAPAKEPAHLPARKEDAEKKFPTVTDPKVLEQVLDQNAELERDPFLHVLWRVWQDTPEKLRAEADPPVAWPALWDDGSAHRGKALRAAGELVQIWELDLPENPAGLPKLFAYRIRAEGAPPNSKGHLYDVFAVEKLKGARRYDRVIAYGRFFKAMVSEAKRLDDPDFHIAVVIARAFERPTYLEEPRIPGPIVDGNRAEARPLYWLLKRARDIPFEELKAQANSRLTYHDFTLWPERYRALPVAISGELRRLIRISLPDNLLDMPDVFYGQIADQDRKMNTFFCIHVPEGVHHKDPVVLYGYFLKKWTYKSEGDYEVTSPIFVAQRLRILDYGEGGSGQVLGIALAAVVGATALALGVAIVVSRRRDRKADDARRQREAARIQAKLHPPEDKPEEPGPPAEP
ncbi:MAG TPA: hypothetical protein VNE39_08905 [Planctomycetota bacterium]|nr:hypothetical protein [Planctomycetota bacterium]